MLTSAKEPLEVFLQRRGLKQQKVIGPIFRLSNQPELQENGPAMETYPDSRKSHRGTLIKCVRPLKTSIATTLVHAFITARIDYCSTI